MVRHQPVQTIPTLGIDEAFLSNADSTEFCSARVTGMRKAFRI